MIVILGLCAFLRCFIYLVQLHDLPKETDYRSRESRSLGTWREALVARTREELPSPHSELMLGMVLGIDDFDRVPRINDVLKVTGTMHVVVVSGYNISLVFNLIVSILGSKYRLRNVVLGLICTLGYALISGFEPPVIRAWIMGSVLAVGKYSGRLLDTGAVLAFTIIVMLLLNPSFISSLSFQLSTLATLGLMVYTRPIGGRVKKMLHVKVFLVEDLVSSLSAQVLVWPLISYQFGTVSVISPLVNMLVLWTVSWSTILGVVFLTLSLFGPLASKIGAIVVYPSLDTFVRVVYWFSHFKWCSLEYKISSVGLCLYYGLLFLLYVGGSYFSRRKSYAG